MKKRKICIITGTRADYGLLMPLLHEIKNDADLQLQLIATGMHLSQEFGLTYKEIEKDFEIDKKIEILLSSDTSIGISKSMGLAQISFSEVYNDLNPDIIVVLGDRFEIFSAVIAALLTRIPVAHMSGGELTQGVIDDSIRHSITKMSHIHFVATEEYKKRVVQLGEDPKKIFNYGEAGLDNLVNLTLLNKEEFENSINFKLKKKCLLITYHPTTLDNIQTVILDFQNILDSLADLIDTSLIFTKANSDEGGRKINKMIDDYVRKNKNSIAFVSLGQVRYLSALKFVDAVIGNSSSGIVEAPSFKIGTINIGSRQKGRVQSKSTINCKPEKEFIKIALSELYDKNFQKKLKSVINPYVQSKSSYRTKETLKNINISDLIKKEFKDLP